MRILDLMAVVLTMSVAIFVVAHPTPSLIGYGCALVLSGYTAFLLTQPSTSGADRPFVQFGRLRWSQEDFCRGWLITGRTGSGKTASGVVLILSQLFANAPNWGGLCIDDKGLFWEVLQRIARGSSVTDKLILLQIKPEGSSADWQPQFRYNLIGDVRVPASLYAKTIVDVGGSLGGGAGKDFFKTQAQIHLEKGIEALRVVGAYCHLLNLYQLLAFDQDLEELLEALAQSEHPRTPHLLEHFTSSFRNQPPEQLGGVRSTIFNYLHYFTEPKLAEVFCPTENSFDFDQIDQGKIVCVAIPNKFQIERRYINTFLKLAFYTHALRRFDQTPEQRADNNVLVFVADEAQQIVTAAESGLSDHGVIDKIREAKATVIFATQSTTSFIPPLGGHDKANVLLLNLANRIYFTLADDPAATLAAKHIGQRTVRKRTVSRNQGKTGYSWAEQDEFILKPQVLRALKKFEAVVCHCEQGWQQLKLLPTKFTAPSQPSSSSESL